MVPGGAEVAMTSLTQELLLRPTCVKLTPTASSLTNLPHLGPVRVTPAREGFVYLVTTEVFR